MEPLLQCRSMKARNSFGIDHGYLFTFVQIPACCSLVIVLLLFGGPTTVAWFIVPIVIDAVDAMNFAWSISHVGKEIGKTLSPARAYSDAPAAVAWEVLNVRVCASVNNGPPRLPFRRSSFAVCSVRVVCEKCNASRCLFLTAAAAFGATITQILTPRNALVAAIAATNPPRGPAVAITSR